MSWINALDRELRSWEGTPYAEGQQCRGVAVNCLGLLTGVYDALHLIIEPPPHLGGLPLLTITRLLKDRYGLVRLAAGEPAEPGDAALFRGDPAHVGIVDLDVRLTWHAGRGVGVGRRSTLDAARFWRPTRRHLWK